MRYINIIILLLLNSSSLLAQTIITIEGTAVNSAETANWDGVNIPRNQPTTFTYRNNSITSVNVSGYMLQAGDETPTGSNNNLDGEIISGNKFIRNGSDAASITRGVFTGYNLNATLRYNLLIGVPLGLLRKSNGMTNSSGGVAYNIVINPKSAVVAKGMNNVNVYNNTFYSSLLTTQSGRGLVDIYTNTDYGLNAPSTGLVTAVYNGTVTASATAKDGSGVTARLIISVLTRSYLLHLLLLLEQVVLRASLATMDLFSLA